MLLGVNIDILSLILGFSVGSLLTILYFVFLKRSDWLTDAQDDIELDAHKDGIKIIRKGQKIDEEVKNMSDDELDKLISK